MKLLLVRGLPGSGKSTIAKNLIGWYTHREADMFWITDGVYKFERERLKEALAWCQQETIDLLTAGFSPVVSNTFTTKRELQPYFDIAKQFNIAPTVLLCQNNWGDIHNVPQEVYDAMAERFEYDISELFL